MKNYFVFVKRVAGLRKLYALADKEDNQSCVIGTSIFSDCMEVTAQQKFCNFEGGYVALTKKYIENSEFDFVRDEIDFMK